MVTKDKHLNVVFTEEDHKLIREIAEGKKISVSELIRGAMIPFIISKRAKKVLRGKVSKGEIINLIDTITEYQKQIEIAMIDMQNIEQSISAYKQMLNDNSIPFFKDRDKKKYRV